MGSPQFDEMLSMLCPLSRPHVVALSKIEEERKRLWKERSLVEQAMVDKKYGVLIDGKWKCDVQKNGGAV